ncbi:hypothetical protein J1N35_004542 [Gossypium stocksii]|uniref:Uncharacterized protein n=1 Tax=Gossypium stocksii TaxID=47602 RepID=A0A9D4AG65_9ROSI|nr:hypothetical protein J1N35_004542 [Gossypium stocksii]
MKINHNARETKKASKKVGVIFKSTTHEKYDDSSNDGEEDEEEEMVMFVKKFKKCMKFSKSKRLPRRETSLKVNQTRKKMTLLNATSAKSRVISNLNALNRRRKGIKTEEESYNGILKR